MTIQMKASEQYFFWYLWTLSLMRKNLNLKVFRCRRLKGVHGVVLSTDDYFYRNQRCIYFVYIVLFALLLYFMCQIYMYNL